MSQAGTRTPNSGPGGFVQTLTGNTGGPVPPTAGNINVVGDVTTINVAGNPGTSTLTISTSGSVATTYDGDTGSATPSGGIINFVAGGLTLPPTSILNSGGVFTASGSTIDLTFNYLNMPDTTASGKGIIYLAQDRFLHNYCATSGFNTFVGETAGNLTMTTASGNTGVGLSALLRLTVGTNNTAVGQAALVNADSVGCTGIGYLAGSANTTGSFNTALGWTALQNLTTGLHNTAIGVDSSNGSGSNLTSNENYNLLLNNQGVTGESNAIRIGNSVNSFFSGGKTYIFGIYGNPVPNPSTNSLVVIDGTSNQIGYLGLATNGQIPIGSTGGAPVLNTITPGSGISITNGANSITIASTVVGGIQTINGNTGSVTGTTVTLEGTPSSVGTLNFSGSGSTMLLNGADANLNVILTQNMPSLPTGTGNVGMGYLTFAQGSLVTGSFNTSIGQNSFTALTSGTLNVGLGSQALLALTTGSFNTSLSAFQGGKNYTSSESSNISINASATTVTGESHVLRIGDGTGTGTQQLNKAFVSGINGTTSTGTTVVVSSGDQLTAGGIATNASQPAFSAYLSANTANNVTGDGTSYTVICDTVVFDQASNYNNATGVFTAPVSGRYQFNVIVVLQNITTQTAFQTKIVTTGGTFVNQQGIGGIFSGIDYIPLSIFCNMAAGNTMTLQTAAFGSTKTVGVVGTAINTYISGYLVC